MSIVSVCITTYNRKDLLFKAVKSVCQQSYKNIEIIIVDDCSNDGTDVIVKDKLLELDHRINYIRHKTNRGLASARNTALRNAKGKFYTFIDDDDEVSSDYIQKILKAIESNPDCCSLTGEITWDSTNPEIFEHSIKYSEWKTNESGTPKYERYPNH